MNKFFGLVLALYSITVGDMQGFTFTFLNISQTWPKPFTKIPCPESCTKNIETGMKIMGLVFDSAMKNLPFSVDFCDQCVIRDLSGFTHSDICFMSKNKYVYDHQVELLFPRAFATCKCQLSTSPKATADKVNSAKSPEGQCGFKRLQNTHKCNDLKCADETMEDKPTNITINFNIQNAILKTILRADKSWDSSESDEFFPISSSMTTITDLREAISIEGGDGHFDEARKCLQENLAGFYCKIFGNAWSHFFDCVDGDAQVSLLTAVLREYFACNDYNMVM